MTTAAAALRAGLDRVEATLRDTISRAHLVWVGGTALMGIALAFLLAGHPFLSAGIVGGGLVVVLLLVRPLLILGTVLAVGLVNLAFITGGQRQLLDSLGGLDMNGIRLIGVVFGFGALLLIDRGMLRQALGSSGRWYLLFLLYAAGTLLISPSPIEGLRLLFKLAYPFLIFVAVASLPDRRSDLDRLGDVTLIAAAVLVMVVNPLVVLAGGYTVDDAGYLRIEGLGMHQNPFSQYLLVMSFLALARFLTRGQLRYVILTVCLGGWIVLTQTRIALLAAVIGLVALAIYAAILRGTGKPVLAAGILGAGLTAALLPIVLERTLGFVPGPVELIELLSDPRALAATMTWSGRESIWPVLYAAFLGSPIIGLGLGASGPVLRTSFSSAVTDIPHNEYLRILVDTGVVGLVLLVLALIIWGVRAAIAGRQATGTSREFAIAAVGAVAAAGVVAITDNPIDYYSQFTQYVAFYCAAAVAGATTLASTDSSGPPPVAAEVGSGAGQP